MDKKILNYDPTIKQYTIFFPNTCHYYYIDENDYCKPLGKGANGIVLKATNQNKDFNAIKLISKKIATWSRVHEEINILQSVANYDDKSHLCHAVDIAEDSTYWYIAMPFYDQGTLSNLIQSNQITNEIEAIEYLRQIAYGVNTLHSHYIIHRDLKSDNIMVNTYEDPSYPLHYYLVICDFGLSKNGYIEQNPANTAYVGTAFTRAPEMRQNQYNCKADIFSLGCIFYKMLTQQEPFLADTVCKVEDLKDLPNLKITSCFGSYLSKISMEILEGCLQSNPENRLSMEELDKLIKYSSIYNCYETLDVESIKFEQTINILSFSRKGITQGSNKNVMLYNPDDSNKIIDQNKLLKEANEKLSNELLNLYNQANLSKAKLTNSESIAIQLRTDLNQKLDDNKKLTMKINELQSDINKEFKERLPNLAMKTFADKSINTYLNCFQRNKILLCDISSYKKQTAGNASSKGAVRIKKASPSLSCNGNKRSMYTFIKEQSRLCGE